MCHKVSRYNFIPKFHNDIHIVNIDLYKYEYLVDYFITHYWQNVVVCDVMTDDRVRQFLFKLVDKLNGFLVIDLFISKAPRVFLSKCVTSGIESAIY